VIRWQWCDFLQLTAAEVYAILAERCRVFAVEQQSIYQDADGLDLQAEHVIAWAGSDIAAYLRVLSPGVKYRERSIGRVLTRSTFRRTGLGRELLTRALTAIDARFPEEPIRISAQLYLERFYGSFGFVRVSDPYDEDGIEHIEMLRAR
jgi:ElaA protein